MSETESGLGIEVNARLLLVFAAVVLFFGYGVLTARRPVPTNKPVRVIGNEDAYVADYWIQLGNDPDWQRQYLIDRR